MNLDDLDRTVQRLMKQQPTGIQCTVFLEDIAKELDRWEKYKDSYAGNVINLQIVGVENALLLFCDRVWDSGADAQSIPNAVRMLTHLKEKVLERRKFDVDVQFVPDWYEDQAALLQQIVSDTERLKDHQVRRVIRVIRTEHLAHLVEQSKDRARHFPSGFDDHGVRRNDLYSFAKDTIQLIERIELITSGNSADFDASAAVFRIYCQDYWENLPVFRDSERE